MGRAIDSVEIKLEGKMSPKPREGIVKVIKITLIPSIGYPDLLSKKGTLKRLKIGLKQRSPDEFIYDIYIENAVASLNHS